MDTRTPPIRQLIAPVAFALLCVTLMIVTWVSFSGSVPLQPQGYRVFVWLPKADNVYPQTSVRIAGVAVGKVATVALQGDRAHVALEFQPAFAPIHSGARVIVRSKTLLGEAYIELAPGPRTAPMLTDGRTLPAGQVVVGQGLTDVLETFTPGTRARLRAAVTGLAAGLRGRGPALSGALGYAAPVAENLAAVASTLDGQASQLTKLVRNGGTILGVAGEQSGALESLVRNGDSVFAVTAARDRALAATVATLPAFLGELRSSATVLGATSGDLQGATSALAAATPSLVPALQAVNAIAPVAQMLLRGLPATIAGGDVGLPALTGVLRTAGHPLATLHTALRQLIPVVQLLSADRNSVVASLANAGQINNGVTQSLDGRRVHYAAGAITLWNESVAGWVKRLPTNRDNPYPAPDSELDIAHGGLKAYDCRNTGNPLYLPPTGTGAPPCRPQGPWTFNGVSADYPRLTEAPR